MDDSSPKRTDITQNNIQKMYQIGLRGSNMNKKTLPNMNIDQLVENFLNKDSELLNY